MKRKAAIVLDTSPIYVSGLSAFFARHCYEVSTFNSVAEFDAHITSDTIVSNSVIVIGPHIGELIAFQALHRTRSKLGKEICIVAVGLDSSDLDTQADLLYSGASGYVCATASEHEWYEFLKCIGSGQINFLPTVINQARTQIDLTTSERDILKLVVEGKHDREIAEQFDKSIHTVHSQINSAMSKLQVSTRQAASRRATIRGII